MTEDLIEPGGFTAAVVDTVNGAASNVLSDGRAIISFERHDSGRGEWLAMHLSPRNPDACPVVIALYDLDEGRLLELSLGRHGTHYEIHGENDFVLNELAAIIRMAIDGKYQERVRLRVGGELASSKATFQFEDGPHEYTYMDAPFHWPWTTRRIGAWKRIHYTRTRRSPDNLCPSFARPT